MDRKLRIGFAASADDMDVTRMLDCDRLVVVGDGLPGRFGRSVVVDASEPGVERLGGVALCWGKGAALRRAVAEVPDPVVVVVSTKGSPKVTRGGSVVVRLDQLRRGVVVAGFGEVEVEWSEELRASRSRRRSETGPDTDKGSGVQENGQSLGEASVDEGDVELSE